MLWPIKQSFEAAFHCLLFMPLHLYPSLLDIKRKQANFLDFPNLIFPSTKLSSFQAFLFPPLQERAQLTHQYNIKSIKRNFSNGSTPL